MHGGDKAQCTGLLLFVSIRVLGTLSSVQPWPANPLSLRREAEERLVQRLLPHVLAATPFPKPWCLNILLWRGGVLPSNDHSTVSAMWLWGTGSSGPASLPDH